MNTYTIYLVYAVPLLAALLFHLTRRHKHHKHAVTVKEEAISAGLIEPPSLHPVINPAICVGSASCVRACPEKSLGIVNGKAELVNPSHCIGHGACHASCPVGAITLVFGTERRGIDIPYVKPTFETNVPGIYIAGELGGMGLIRKSAEQGKQAIDSIAKNRGEGDQLDVVIVGSGPAGLASTLGAMEKKLRFITLEQEDSLGGCVYHYPRGKVVMTQSVVLPLAGKVKFTGEVSKESLLKIWLDLVEEFKIPITFSSRVEKIIPDGKGFIVKTPFKEYRTRSVLLSIGRRGTPRKLDVPGEDLPKVVYRVVDAQQYQGKHVLVVGGGDSAIEAAMAVGAEPGTTVTLSYRSAAFARLKPKNRERLGEAEAAGRVRVLLGSTVARVEEKMVVLEQEGQPVVLKNDAVVVCAGGILPTPMLKEIGIKVETKHGTE